jgi:hypothetical protein
VVGFVEFELAEILALEQVLRRLGDENMSSGCPLKELATPAYGRTE